MSNPNFQAQKPLEKSLEPLVAAHLAVLAAQNRIAESMLDYLPGKIKGMDKILLAMRKLKEIEESLEIASE